MPQVSHEERLSLVERDSRDHARIISEIHKSLAGIEAFIRSSELKEAARERDNVHLDERLDQIDKRLDGISSLGKWALAAAGGTVVAALVTFVVNGGLRNVGGP